jgi:hypothetical protein
MRPIVDEISVKPARCDGSAPALGADNVNVDAALVNQVVFDHSEGRAVRPGRPCLAYCESMHVRDANAGTLRVNPVVFLTAGLWRAYKWLPSGLYQVRRFEPLAWWVTSCPGVSSGYPHVRVERL